MAKKTAPKKSQHAQKPAKALKKGAAAKGKVASGKAASAKAAPASKSAPVKAAVAKTAAAKTAPAKAGAKGKGRGKEELPVPSPSVPPPRRDGSVFLGPMPDKQLPRGTKVPAVGEALTKREMEQVLTVGFGRGVGGEGSLKGRLFVHLGFPYLEVIGRDKRELVFLLQGPDQEVLPAYADHKVSVSGLIRRTNNHGGIVDVRKYSAKKPEVEVPVVEEVEAQDKLRFLSPGEVEQISSPGMGAGMKGFAAIRGTLEMTGEDFFLVVSNGGTRQQVSFVLEGKNARNLKRNVGHTLHVTGVVEKTSGWGGNIQVETCEPRISEHRPVSRDQIDVVELEVSGSQGAGEVKMNGGLSIRFPERAGYTWAVEPTTAKRIGLREANFELKSGGGATREFFFTPRNPGQHEVEFFLAKAFNPMQVSKTYKLQLNVKSIEQHPAAVMGSAL